MTPIRILSLITLIMSTALADDLVISNNYYAMEVEARDNLVLHNMDYYNKASIYPGLICSESTSKAPAGSVDSNASNGIALISPSGLVSAFVDVNGLGASYNKNIKVEVQSSSAEINYNYTSGFSSLSLANQASSLYEAIVANNATYMQSLGVSTAGLHSDGSGRSLGNFSNGFADDFSLHSFNRSAEISGNLSTYDPIVGNDSVRYSWVTSTMVQPGFAMSRMQTVGYNGNKNMSFMIAGASSDLPDKAAGPVYLARRNKTYVISQNIMMMYLMDTGGS
ncbi:MAG TPA: hypothetical protein VN455_07945 [Methanotrichaceae archaeon]|nr:hypothetical protein [Methanotrichaceae archaeon]